MKRFIIDGFNLAYRSHFAFKNLTTTAGLPSGGVYGFMTSTRALKKRFPDFKFYVVWDNEASNKKEVYSEYKANRTPFRVDLPIRDLKDALKCVNIIQVEVPREEADDVIASLVRAPEDFSDNSDNNVIVSSQENLDYVYTSDKDMLQLVRDGRVIVISPKVGTIQEKSYDEEAVKAKYGVGPKDLACFFTFRGDSVDNVPGVPRVPSKVLASLSDKYKDPEKIYENLEKETLTDFQRQSIYNFRDQALINSSLISLKRNLLYQTTEGKADPEGYQKFLDKYEIRALSAVSYVELFNNDNSFLTREGPHLKTYSLFDGE